MTLASPGANWLTAAEAQFGQQARWLVTMSNGSPSWTMYVSNVKYTLGFTWQPWLLSVADIRFEVPDDDVVAVLAGCILRIRRSSTVDTNLDDDASIGATVDVTLQFVSSGTLGLVLATDLVIDKITFTNESEVEVTCVKARSELLDVPNKILDTANFSALTNDTQMEVGRTEPFVFGNVVNTGGVSGNVVRAGYRHNLCRKPFCAPTRIIGRSTTANRYLFEMNYLAGQYSPNYGSAFEYIPGWQAYALIETHEAAVSAAYTEPRRNWGQVSSDSRVMCSIRREDEDMTSPTLADVGGMRAYYDLLTDSYEVGTTNNNDPATFWVPDWGSAAQIDYTNRRISVVASKSLSAPPEATLSAVWLYFYASDVTATGGGVKVYKGTRSTDARGTALLTFFSPDEYVVAMTAQWDQKDFFFLIELDTPGVSDLVDIYNVSLYYRFTVPFTAMRTYRYSEFTGEWAQRRFVGGSRHNVPVIRRWSETYATSVLEDTSRIFVENKGPNATVQPVATSYNSDSLPYVVYYWLNTVLGVSSSYLDGAMFDDVYAYLVTDSGGNFNAHQIGRALLEPVDTLEVIADLCKAFGVLFFRGADRKYKIRMRNVAGTVFATFADNATDYPAWDFRWEWVSKYYNRFEFSYHWNPALGRYNERLELNKDATVSSFLTASKTACSTANTSYGGESDTLTMDLPWIWDINGAENIAKTWARWWTVIRRRVSFTTKLSAARLEIGDTIRTNHQSQPWTSTAVDFQVMRVVTDGTDNTVRVEALEMNPL